MIGSRTLLIGLVLSIGLNLLLIGGIVGNALRPTPPPPPTPGPSAGPGGGGPERLIARALIAETPEADRRAVRQELRQSWRDTASLRRKVDQARNEVVAAMVSDPYDEDRTISAMETLADAENALRVTIQSNLARRLGKLSPETRERLAESMSRRGQRRVRVPRQRIEREREDPT